MASTEKFDWIKIRQEWEAGAPIAKLAARYRCSTASIHIHKKKEVWVPKHAAKTKGFMAVVEENQRRALDGGDKEVPRGRSIGQPMGEVGADREMLSHFQAIAQISAPEANAIHIQAMTEIELTRSHRRTISRASVVAENILVRLHDLVINGLASDVISFKTKAGEAYHRVPFLGDRESVSDALIKCVNAISKLVPLERQAHGLKDDDLGKLPRVTFNMPSVQIVSVDGSGHVVKTEDRPALIEGEAEDGTEQQTVQ